MRKLVFILSGNSIIELPHCCWNNITGITLKNITVEGKVLHPNVLKGASENGIVSRVGDITLQNIKINGRKATTLEDTGGWISDEKTTGPITIK